MKKRINFYFIVLILLCVMLLSASISVIMSGLSKSREMASVRGQARLTADLLVKGIAPEYSGLVFSDYITQDASAARLTIIAPDGTVLLDNFAAAATMENHGDREEFIAALLTGSGESTRYSGTLGADTYYYAVRLDDGNVLRVSKTVQTITGIFASVLPAVVIVAILLSVASGITAGQLTRSILRPLNEIDWDSDNSAMYDELVPYAKKIDQQKREIANKIAALKNRADTIEVITDNMKEGLILIDKTGIVLIANNSANDVFDEVGMAQKNILHICREMEFQQGVRQCLSGLSSEFIFHRGAKIYNIYFSPVLGEDSINGGVILFFDITERHEAEKYRREFSANVSHELKTPLTSISAMAEMIGNGMARNEDIKGFAEKITNQSQRLISIIEDIIRLSEFDEGKLSRDYQEFDFYELAASVAEVLREKADEKQVAVTVKGESVCAAANKQMIDELLYNLLDNAIKYNKENGSVTVALSRENGYCKIAVSDTGIGIPNGHRGRVFERFYRVDKSRSKKTGGTGLGLSIVKHITEHHGGKIKLESVEGAGTTITCWISTNGISMSTG